MFYNGIGRGLQRDIYNMQNIFLYCCHYCYYYLLIRIMQIHRTKQCICTCNTDSFNGIWNMQILYEEIVFCVCFYCLWFSLHVICLFFLFVSEQIVCSCIFRNKTNKQTKHTNQQNIYVFMSWYKACTKDQQQQLEDQNNHHWKSTLFLLQPW